MPSGVVAELHQFARPKLRAAASFEANQAPRDLGEEGPYFASSELLSKNGPAIRADTVNLEPAFRISTARGSHGTGSKNRHRCTDKRSVVVRGQSQERHIDTYPGITRARLPWAGLARRG